MWKYLRYLPVVIVPLILFLVARRDMSEVNRIATQNSRDTAMLTKFTRLEHERLVFQSLAMDYSLGVSNIDKKQVILAFDLLWSRVSSQLTLSPPPTEEGLKEAQNELPLYLDMLRSIDADVHNLQVGDTAALRRIRSGLDRFVSVMDRADTTSYNQINRRAVSTLMLQKTTSRVFTNIQWLFLITNLGGLAFLIHQLRQREVLLSRLKAREKQISDLAMKDHLTGLHNRRWLDETLAAAEQNQDCKAFSLILLDLDGFKQINDQHGHATGDLALQLVAGRLSQAIGHPAQLARLGGDEFAITLHTTGNDVITTAKAALACFNTALVIDGQRLPLGASLGIASYLGQVVSKRLLRDADKALYEAKASGGNRFVFHSSSLQDHAELMRGATASTQPASLDKVG